MKCLVVLFGLFVLLVSAAYAVVPGRPCPRDGISSDWTGYQTDFGQCEYEHITTDIFGNVNGKHKFYASCN
jgi:hypothetical protein